MVLERIERGRRREVGDDYSSRPEKRSMSAQRLAIGAESATYMLSRRKRRKGLGGRRRSSAKLKLWGLPFPLFLTSNDDDELVPPSFLFFSLSIPFGHAPPFFHLAFQNSQLLTSNLYNLTSNDVALSLRSSRRRSVHSLPSPLRPGSQDNFFRSRRRRCQS